MKNEAVEIENDGTAMEGVGVQNSAPETGAVDGDCAEDCAVDCAEIRYRADQVVCIECEHVREMKGETDEVVRRTRSEAAENAVLNAVREGGVEPNWFVERWIDNGDEKVLVACAVFEDADMCAGFRKAVNDFAEKLRARGDEVPVRLRSDAELEKAVAEHFSAEWARRRKEQMEKFGTVMADAKKSGRWEGRVVVGEFVAEGEDGKKVFEKVCEALSDAFPHDEFGEGGVAYSGFWDKGSVARFCFGFEDEGAAYAAKDKLDAIGARFYDPMKEEAKGVELEMSALVIAKMQGEEKARAERKRLADDMAKAVEKGMEKAAGEKVDAEKLIG